MPVESMAFGPGGVGSSPASPISHAPQINNDFVSTQVWSDNSDDEKKGWCMNWTEEDNLKLDSA